MKKFIGYFTTLTLMIDITKIDLIDFIITNSTIRIASI